MAMATHPDDEIDIPDDVENACEELAEEDACLSPYAEKLLDLAT
jgi:hypothetical protein